MQIVGEQRRAACSNSARQGTGRLLCYRKHMRSIKCSVRHTHAHPTVKERYEMFHMSVAW